MISLETVKERLEITDTDRDALIEALIPAVVAFVETYTHRYFGPLELTEETIAGHGKRHLWLRDIPVAVESGVEAVETVGEYEYPGATVDTITHSDTDGFALRTRDHEAWLTRHGGYVWTLGYEYVVEYWRGYIEDAGPADIEQAMIDLISLRLNLTSDGKTLGMRSETIGGYSYTRFGEADFDSLPGVQTTLDAWKRPVIA